MPADLVLPYYWTGLLCQGNIAVGCIQGACQLSCVLPGMDRPHVGSPPQSRLSGMSAWTCLWCCSSKAAPSCPLLFLSSEVLLAAVLGAPEEHSTPCQNHNTYPMGNMPWCTSLKPAALATLITQAVAVRTVQRSSRTRRTGCETFARYSSNRDGESGTATVHH